MKRSDISRVKSLDELRTIRFRNRVRLLDCRYRLGNNAERLLQSISPGKIIMSALNNGKFLLRNIPYFERGYLWALKFFDDRRRE